MNLMLEARVEFIGRASDVSMLWLAYISREKIDTIELARRAVVVAVTPCRFLGRRRFDFGEPGDPLGAVVEVFDTDCETVADLCAWPTKSPSDFATMFGCAPVLGANALHNPASWFGGAALRAWRTPLEWVKANATGFVLLDPRNAQRHFEDVRGDILTEDAAHTFALWRASGLKKQTFIYDDGKK